jgi:hypothetical protein
MEMKIKHGISKEIILLFVACFMLVSCLVYYSTLMMESTYCSEKSVDFQRTTWRYILDNKILRPQSMSFP